MSVIRDVLEALDERRIAQAVRTAHDEARMSYSLTCNTVTSFPEFVQRIGDYYNHHFSRCLSHGGRLSASEAQQRAKDILQKHYRKQNGDAVMAYNDARDGTSGGLRSLLDIIADSIRDESVEYYIRSVFDKYVMPNSWNDQVEIIREFIAQCGALLGPSIDRATPERYARDHQILIRAYVLGLQETGRIFRRL